MNGNYVADGTADEYWNRKGEEKSPERCSMCGEITEEEDLTHSLNGDPICISCHMNSKEDLF
jgi:formylmethanofuran dehydrogenase subunit E